MRKENNNITSKEDTTWSQKNISDNFKVFLIIIIVIIFFMAVDFGFISGRVTEYSIYCDVDKIGDECNFKSFSKTDYYPDIKKQTVKSRSEFGITTYTRCTVIDRRNWECYYDDESGLFGFNKGQFHASTLWSTTRSYEETLKDDVSYEYVPKFFCYLNQILDGVF